MALGTARGMRGDGFGSIMALASVRAMRGDGNWDPHDPVRGREGRWCWVLLSPGFRKGM